MRFFRKLLLLFLIFVMPAAGITCTASPKPPGQNTSSPQQQEQAVSLNSSNETPQYTYRVINTFPHDTGAFTQGMVYENGFFYEGTGLNGRSSLRKVELKSGKILQIKDLDEQYFGEGITILEDKIVQLTWKNHKGFTYDKDTFELFGDFDIATEGWGITTDGKQFIMSDGTSTLHILDSETFEDIGEITVQDRGQLVNNLNELEYINGLIYANVWNSDNIAIIDPGSGRVNGWINLTGILPARPDGKPVDVLNGIAYDTASASLFVTGKYWPSVFEIKLIREPD